MGAMPAQVADLLGWPCASWIMEETISEDGKSVRVGRQVEGALEIFTIPLPCLLSAQKGLNEPRYPTLKGIMGAKKKEIKDVKAADLGLAAARAPPPPAAPLRGAPAGRGKKPARWRGKAARAIGGGGGAGGLRGGRAHEELGAG